MCEPNIGKVSKEDLRPLFNCLFSTSSSSSSGVGSTAASPPSSQSSGGVVPGAFVPAAPSAKRVFKVIVVGDAVTGKTAWARSVVRMPYFFIVPIFIFIFY
jgi:hypothetical protein